MLSSWFTAKALTLKSTLQEEQYKAAKTQRDLQLAIGLAQARDNLMWYGGLYTSLLSCVTVQAVKGGVASVPKVLAVPVAVGGFTLLNLYDFAYGTKLQRVTLEAELILETERGRLVPPKQAPFANLYTSGEVAMNSSEAVGVHWPFFLPFSRK